MYKRWARSARLKRYAQSYCSRSGWLSKPSILLWDAFLEFQEASGIRGHLFEIGVYKGKSAFLSTLFSRPDEHCWFLDARMDPAFRRDMDALKPEGAHYLEMHSEGLAEEIDAHVTQRETFRWIHVDGGHTAPLVVNDLVIADALLAADGMVVADDFLSPAFPQVSEGVFRFLQEHPDRLSLILSGFNKGYMVRPAAVERYERFIQEDLPAHLRSRRFRDFSIFSPRRRGELLGTSGYGIVGRTQDRDFVDAM